MRKGCLVLGALILVCGTPKLKSQSVCTSSAVTYTFPCGGGPGQGSSSCTISIPGSGANQDIYYVPVSTFCCGGSENTYIDAGSCTIVNGKLDLPALQRLLEYSKTHEILTASCNGQYYPAQALLRQPPPKIAPQSLDTRKAIASLEAR